jgi:hypothetical protein
MGWQPVIRTTALEAAIFHFFTRPERWFNQLNGVANNRAVLQAVSRMG